MSTIGYPGATFQIAVDGTPVMACRAKRVTYTRGGIDITDGESDGFRRMLGELDMRGIDVQVDGVTTPENWPRLRDEWAGQTLSEIEIWHPDGTVQIASAFLSNLTMQAETRGAVLFTASWTLSGRVDGLVSLYLTSRPYAIEQQDAMLVAAASRSGYTVSPTRDDLDVVLTPLGGGFFGGLIDTTMGPEELDVVLAALGGELFGGLISYSMGPEALDVATGALGGELFGDLIDYTMQPEALDVGVAALGGELE